MPEPKFCSFIKKETLAQVFSCEFCEISKNTFHIEHLQTSASASWLQLSSPYFFLGTGIFLANEAILHNNVNVLTILKQYMENQKRVLLVHSKELKVFV